MQLTINLDYEQLHLCDYGSDRKTVPWILYRSY